MSIDTYLLNKIEEVTPRINPLIANGIATRYMKDADQYVDDILTDASRNFPSGLRFIRSERCTPFEEFRKVTEKGVKTTVDIARCELYLRRYYFEYDGKPLDPKYLYLPSVGPAGSLVLNGGRFFVSPVLSDVVISYGQNDVFVRLLRAKVRFHRIAQSIIVTNADGVDHERPVQVVWSMIHNKNEAMRKLKSPVKAHTTLPHYLFCKYGFYEAMNRFGKCNPVVGTTDITPVNYPPQDWVIVTSTRKPPRGRAKGYYEPTNIRIAIRREEYSDVAESMVAGFFYVTDYFPDRMNVEWVDSPRLWKILMGLILFSDMYSEGRLHDDIDKHIDSLDSYMDNIVRIKLSDIGYNCDDIYQLMAVIIENFNKWIFTVKDDINTMYGKELSILYDVLYDITNSIFHMLFNLRAVTKKPLTKDAVERTMGKHFRMKTIFGILKQHKGVNALGYSGDNKFFKLTSELVPQSSSGGRGASKERLSVDDQYLYIHASVAEVGGYLFLPKPDPSGHARISPFVQVGPKGQIMPNPEFAPLIAEVQGKLSRRASNTEMATHYLDEEEPESEFEPRLELVSEPSPDQD